MITVRRERAQAPQFAAAVEAVRRSAEALVDRPMLVPDEGVAGWNHQYICPDHGVMLAFDWESPHRHRCPVDGALHEGPLLDAAWWRQLNAQWADGSVAMGVAWQLSGDERFFEQTRQVLLAYARHYPGYAVHGGIPFNGPGKANAQTICDANCLIALALAFDLIRQGLTDEDARSIQEDLLSCGARFLIEHHERQIHNHQCWIAAAIGIIGLVVGNDEWVEYAVNGPFGLAQQLSEGVGEDGFWPEGSVGYHLYALRPLTRFAALARGTRWDISRVPQLQAMYRALRPMTLPDGAYPHINDVVAVQKPAALVPMLETAYGWDGDPELGALLAEALGDAPRNTLEALLFGADRIERINALTPIGSYSNKGLSILRDGSAYLMVKHSDGGNEHDHFDRLGLSFMAQGEQMAPDIGTVYYGHPLHWSWFKTTLSHNTVLLGGLPHPPGRAGVTVATDRVIDAWAEWPKSQDYYSGARFRRRIEWRGDHFIDQFEVATEMPTRVEYVFHTRGVLQTAPPGRPYTEWNPLPPYRHLTDLTARPVATAELRWAFSNGATLTADVQTKGLLITGRSPDYPWSKQRSTLLLRQEEQTHTTFTVVYTIGG